MEDGFAYNQVISETTISVPPPEQHPNIIMDPSRQHIKHLPDVPAKSQQESHESRPMSFLFLPTLALPRSCSFTPSFPVFRPQIPLKTKKGPMLWEGVTQMLRQCSCLQTTRGIAYSLQGQGNASEKATEMALAFDELKSSFGTQRECSFDAQKEAASNVYGWELLGWFSNHPGEALRAVSGSFFFFFFQSWNWGFLLCLSPWFSVCLPRRLYVWSRA